MANCVNCGAEISQEQYQNFNKLCPDCVRVKSVSQKTGFAGVGALGAYFILGAIAFLAFGIFVSEILLLAWGSVLLIMGLICIWVANR